MRVTAPRGIDAHDRTARRCGERKRISGAARPPSHDAPAHRGRRDELAGPHRGRSHRVDGTRALHDAVMAVRAAGARRRLGGILAPDPETGLPGHTRPGQAPSDADRGRSTPFDVASPLLQGDARIVARGRLALTKART